MSLDILMDATNDLAIVNNTMVFTPNQEILSRQEVQITLSMFRGEWFFDTTFGVPYLANDNNPIQLLSKDSSKQAIDNAIRDAVLRRDGIISIASYTSVFNDVNRTLDVQLTAVTESGTITFDTPISL